MWPFLLNRALFALWKKDVLPGWNDIYISATSCNHTPLEMITSTNAAWSELGSYFFRAEGQERGQLPGQLDPVCSSAWPVSGEINQSCNSRHVSQELLTLWLVVTALDLKITTVHHCQCMKNWISSEFKRIAD